MREGRYSVQGRTGSPESLPAGRGLDPGRDKRGPTGPGVETRGCHGRLRQSGDTLSVDIDTERKGPIIGGTQLLTQDGNPQRGTWTES